MWMRPVRWSALAKASVWVLMNRARVESEVSTSTVSLLASSLVVSSANTSPTAWCAFTSANDCVLWVWMIHVSEAMIVRIEPATNQVDLPAAIAGSEAPPGIVCGHVVHAGQLKTVHRGDVAVEKQQ